MSTVIKKIIKGNKKSGFFLFQALEYAREQVRYIPADSIKDHSHSVEPDERHGKQQQQPPKPNHHNDGSSKFIYS